MTLTNIQLQTMPKVELHIHLDGSVRPETIIELAKRQGKQPPASSIDQLHQMMSAPVDCQNLNQYLSTFDVVLPYMQTKDALETIAYELIEQVAAHHVKYIEVRYAPQLHRAEGLSVADTYEAVINGLQRGEKQFGVIARCIGICLRGHTAEQNMEVIEQSVHFLGKGLVAVDLAGAEALYPPQLYKQHFVRAQQLSLPITIHAGEAAGAESIEIAIRQLGASRIGHGIRLQDDEVLLEEVKARGITLECCPISNMQTKACESWGQYPLISYLNQGLKVTVNTDNLTVSQTDLTKEFEMLQLHCHLTVEQMAQLQRNAIASIFVEPALKDSIRDKFEADLQQWVELVQ